MSEGITPTRSIRLGPALVDYAKGIGGGNFSRGVVLIIEAHIKTSKEHKDASSK